jgi:type VI secretion system protein ImpB
MKPHVAFAVDNKLSDDANAGQLKVDLNFKSLSDFDPASVAQQVKPLKELMDLRQKLSDLRGQLQTNEKLDDLLMNVVQDKDKLAKLKGELEAQKGKGGEDA